MAAGQAEATERMLRLAAFLANQRTATMRDIIENVPGYGDPSSPTTEGQRKKVRRDLVALRESFGVDTEFSSGLEAYELQPSWVTSDERRAILAAAALVWVEGISPSEQVDALGASFDGSTQRVVLQVHERLLDLRTAITERRRLAFGYNGRVRTAEPWAIGFWHKYTYLFARECTSGESKYFRLDRIERDEDGAWSLKLLDDTFELPDDLDRSHWFQLDPNDWGGDPVFTAQVEVDAEHRHRFAGEFARCRAVAENSGTVTFEIDVRHRRSTIDRLLAFGTHAVATAPDEFVAEICEHLQRTIEAGR